MVAPCQAQNGRLFLTGAGGQSERKQWQKVGTKADSGAFKRTVGQKKEPLPRANWTYRRELRKKS